MRILLVTDIHGEEDKLENILNEANFDAVLCAGDISDAEKYTDYTERLNRILDVFEEKSDLTKAVPGNMDKKDECIDLLINRRMNIHKRIENMKGTEALGFGGGRTPFDTPFEPTEEQISKNLGTLAGRMGSGSKALAVHMPPKDTCLDNVDGEHVGSNAVRDVIRENPFEIALTGHIHESPGIEEMNGTHVVNPGPVIEGNYAVYETEDSAPPQIKQL